MPNTPRIAVIGHVEHVTIARVPALPQSGDIAHLDHSLTIPGGGGGIAYFQLARSPAEAHVFTALGDDDAGRFVGERLEASGGVMHAVPRDQPHTRDLVLVTPDGERTIFVIGEPLHPRRDDAMPWELLASFRAAYFTAQDPALLQAARAAEQLIVTARRAQALARSGVRADVVVGSAHDPRESASLRDYAVPPGALVMTEGRDGGRIETAGAVAHFAAAPAPRPAEGAYGAGDSFAGALVWYLACGLPVEDACARAAEHAAAVLRGLNPLDHQLPLDWPQR